MQIRHYQSEDSNDIADLFHSSVHAIPERIYSAQEKEAWAPTPPDYDHWRRRLAIKQPFVAVLDGDIVGFIELESDGHIDCLYVRAEEQRKGFASSLLRYALERAKEQGFKRVYVEASKLAAPLFARHGFTTEAENIVRRNGQELVNYRMSLIVTASEKHGIGV